MADVLPLAIVCPQLIHRERELAAVDQLLAASAAGQAQVLLLAGEAGIGKSRLCAAIAARAAGRGFRVAPTGCLADDQALPFAPLVDLLQAARVQYGPEALQAALGPALPALAGLLHGLGPVAQADPNDAGLEKPLLFRALTRVLSPSFSAPAVPTLLVIEDLHWCDAATLEFLPSFVQRSAREPLLLLLSYRDDAVGGDLARLLGALSRLRPAVVELQLGQLDPAGVRQMIAAIFGQARPVRPEFATAIHGLADGNPFVVEELLRALVAAGDIYLERGVWTRKPIEQLRIPRSVAEALRERTAALDVEARRALELAAVLGREFSFTLLRGLTGLAEPALTAALKRLVDLQVLVEADADRFAFRHALAREAIAGTLLARERRALHRTIAELLEREPDGSPDEAKPLRPGLLAYHCYEAGLWTLAAQHSRVAGEQALALFAAAPAAEHFDRAIRALEQLGAGIPPDLWLARGRAREHLGDLPAAAADYERAVAQARASGDRAAEVQALLSLGFLFVGQAYARAGAYLAQALALARAADDALLLVQTLNRLGNWHLMTAQPEHTIPFHEEALALAQAVGDGRELAVTTDLLGIAHLMHGDAPVATRYYEQALAHWRATGERQWQVSTLAAYATRGGNALFATAVCVPTPLDQCLAEAEEALAQARAIAWLNGEATALIWMAALLIPRGEAARARGVLRSAREIALELDHQIWLLTVDGLEGAAALDLLDLATAEQAYRRSLERGRAIGSDYVVLTMSAYLALTLLAQGRAADAEAALPAASGPGLPLQSQAHHQVWYARARLALARGDGPTALGIAERLLGRLAAPWSGEPIGDTTRLAPRLWLLQGEALAVCGELERAGVLLDAAATGASRLGHLPLLWRVQAAQARLAHRRRRGEDVERALAAARTTLEEVAARAPEERRPGFLRGGEAALPPARPQTERGALKARYGGLTAREREVATLVAQGLTSRAIAAALSLSERTVEKHIANLMAKLGVASRAQIAAWAARQGLTDQA